MAKSIPIPIKPLIGPGSQPDQPAATTIGVPFEVDTFTMPDTPEVSDEETALECRDLFIELQRAMSFWNKDSGEAGPVFALDRFRPEALALINQMLGEGEVAIKITIPSGQYDEIRIQESIFVGVWRVRYYKDGQAIADQIEVSALPACVLQSAHQVATDQMPDIVPSQEAMNSPAILAEIRQALKAWEPGAAPFVINLSHLPVTAADNELIDKTLGQGSVHMISRGFGNCHIVSTQLKHVWRVQYYNNAPTRLLILNTMVVAGVPEEALASSEDLADSVNRLQELIHWMSASWNLPAVKN